jgi:C1A family cysteine protease
MNLDEVRQAVEANPEADWVPGETSLSGFEIDPDAMEFLGYVPGPQEPSLAEQEQLAQDGLQAYMALEETPFPSAWDWRDVNGQNYVTPIRDQSTCGSCVAFGTCATVEGTFAVEQQQPDPTIDLSEAQLFYCTARAQGRTCHGRETGGWRVPPALNAFQDPGVPDEQCYPYTPGDQDCTGLCSDWRSRVTTISSWGELTAHDEMKRWLSERGPVVGTLNVYEDFARYYTGGIYRHVLGDVPGGHCICIVGYDDEGGYWIGKNSWGTRWGEAGFFKIAYGECAIDSMMWSVAGVQPS